MASKLTPKRKGFVKDYLATGNATLAVKNNFNVNPNDDNTAASMGSELLRMPKVRQYIDSKIERAAEIVYEIAEGGESDMVRLNASKDILDRGGLKPTEKLISANISFDANSTERTRDLGNRLVGLLRRRN